MGRSKKRKAAAISTAIEDLDLPDGWMEKLVALGPDLAHVLGALAKISASQIKKARTGLPSFSAARWSELAPSFGLSDNLMMTKFDTFSINAVLLPPSFHESTAQAAWRAQDVYQERVAQNREEARIRVFDAYLIPIIGLFQGRIVDRPEGFMAPTAYSSGGEVEHELFMIGGVLFFIIETKLGYEGDHNIAQVFLELLSAAEMNKKATFEGLRVHGLLTDLMSFHFYSYDPIKKRFNFDETLGTSFARDMFMADMICVTNKVFSVILFTYVEGIAATAKKSRERSPASPTGSSPAQQMLRNPTDDNILSTSGLQSHSGPRKSTEQWELALTFAKQCLSKFVEPANSVEDIEKQSCEAIALLTKSVRSIPRISHYSGKEDPSTVDELRDLAHHIVYTKYGTLTAET